MQRYAIIVMAVVVGSILISKVVLGFLRRITGRGPQ